MARYTPQAKKDRDAEIRSRLKILKAAGLHTGDLRKKPTRYAIAKANSAKFADVIAGKAAVIKAPSSRAAKAYSNTFTTFRNKIIVPGSAAPGATIKYSKKKGALTANGRVLPKLSPSDRKGYEIHVHLRAGGSHVIYRTTDLGDIVAFLGHYAQKFKGRYSVTSNGVLIDV